MRVQTAWGSDIPCSGQAAVASPPVPGTTSWSASPAPCPHPPLLHFPRCTEFSRQQDCLSNSGVNVQPSPEWDPIRDLKHNALELQLPGALPGFRGSGLRHPLRLQEGDPGPVRALPGPLFRWRHRCVASARNLVGLRPAPVVLAAAGPALTSFRGPTASLCVPGLSSRCRFRLSPQPRPPPTFGFPARPEPPPELGNHLKPPPRPARPRPATPRPEGSPASALRTRGQPGLVGPRRRPRVGRKTDAA